MPDRGLGYGVLRHLDPAAREPLGAAAVPQLLFNYLGRFAVQDGAPWTPAPDAPPLGDLRDPGMPMGHVLDVDAVVRDGADGPRLSTVFAWPREILGPEDVAALGELWLEALGAMHAHASLPGAGGHTPSDFPFVGLDQAEVDAFEAAVPVLEDVLPATALQEGLFFHALADDDVQDVYVVQHRIDLRGPVDPARLRAAVGRLLDRHPPLRASFHQRADGHVVQVIAGGLEVPWREVGPCSPADAEAVAREEAALRFDLGSAPLLRCTLVALADERARLLITFHHLLADGWSEQVILRDLLAFYAPEGEADPLPAATPYRRYFAWRAEQDRPAAADAWRAALADAGEPTRVAPGATSAAGLRFEDAHAELDPALTAELVARVRERGVTLNTAAAGGVGTGARPPHRARRRRVRDDGLRPAAGDRGHRARRGPVHQHAARARDVGRAPAARRRARRARAARRPTCSTTSTSASRRSCGSPAAASCSTRSWSSRTSRRRTSSGASRGASR